MERCIITGTDGKINKKAFLSFNMIFVKFLNPDFSSFFSDNVQNHVFVLLLILTPAFNRFLIRIQ